jgi:hypothetical protein
MKVRDVMTSEVVGVRPATRLTWEFDDGALEPAEPAEPDPGAASPTARERPRPLRG